MKLNSKDPGIWYERGRQEALNVSILCKKKAPKDQVTYAVNHAKRQYPFLEGTDFLAIYEELNEARLEAGLDYELYPEAKGLKDCHRERQRGFMEASGCSKAEMAAFYNWFWYETHVLHPRGGGENPAAAQDGCSVAYFHDSEDGPIFGRNFDHPMANMDIPAMPNWNHLIHCPVSSLPLLDEEPTERFPVDPFELMSDEIKADINKVVEFLKRYNEFWGPCNTIVVDTNRNAVTIEKSNCRMGVVYPRDGACYTTSFGYEDPDMHAFKVAGDRKYMKKVGITEDSPDWEFWRGCDRRLERLGVLMAQAAQKGPSLRGLSDVLRDHDVPFPARVCLAGEPDETGLWSVVSFVSMMTEKDQRMLYSCVENGRAAYANPPYLVPGNGVAIKSEWTVGTRPIPEGTEQSDAVLAAVQRR